MQNFFTPKSVAVIGASKNSKKIGSIIFKQILTKYKGKAYPINPKQDKILGKKCYSSVLKVRGKIDLGVIAVPAQAVLNVVDSCGKKGIKNLIIVSSGFKEIGHHELEKNLYSLLKKYKIKCVGPNCLGVFDAHSNLDTLFLPEDKLTRPKKGGISFISQSGALGSALVDLAAYDNYGFSKFISYGNATNLDESDYLDYLGKDPKTKVICLYVEGVKDGKKFLRTCKRIKKPIIVIKGGKTKKGSEATLSHTGSMAGSYEIYKGAFKQANLIVADSLEQMFHIAKLFTTCPTPKGKRVQVITNGGGYGIVTADGLELQGLELAKLTHYSTAKLRKKLSHLCSISNPMDLVGDADTKRYKLAVQTCLRDRNNDILLVVLLPQTPLITKDVTKIFSKTKKPVVLVMTGGKQTQQFKKVLEDQGLPVFDFPDHAVKALAKFTY